MWCSCRSHAVVGSSTTCLTKAVRPSERPTSHRELLVYPRATGAAATTELPSRPSRMSATCRGIVESGLRISLKVGPTPPRPRLLLTWPTYLRPQGIAMVLQLGLGRTAGRGDDASWPMVGARVVDAAPRPARRRRDAGRVWPSPVKLATRNSGGKWPTSRGPISAASGSGRRP